MKISQRSVLMYGATLTPLNAGAVQIDLTEAPAALRDSIPYGQNMRFKARFELPVHEGEFYLSRTHPIVEGLATYVMDAALDPIAGEANAARRCGVIRTSKVEKRTTLLLVRMRFHIVTIQAKVERPLLAEDCQLLAFSGTPARAQWIDNAEYTNRLLELAAEANIFPGQAEHFLRQLLDNMILLQPHLEQVARERGEELLRAHRRVRSASQARGIRYRVEPQLPVDILGTYIYLPTM